MGKTPVVGVKDRETNKVSAEVVDKTDKPTLQGFVEERTEDSAIVYTDEARAYVGLDRAHEAIRHSVWRVCAWTGTHEWARIVLGEHEARYQGVYHWMSAKHLHRYVSEFEGRHNDRPLDSAHSDDLHGAGHDG